MVIIAICLSISMVVAVKVLDTDRNLPSYSAEQKVKELLWETKRLKQFENEDYSFSAYKINKEVDELYADQGIYKVKFTVQAGRKLDEYKYVIASQ